MTVQERARRHRGGTGPAGATSAAAPAATRAPLIVLGAVCVLIVATLMRLTRGVSFYFDEWNFLLDRRGHSVGAFLRPHNEHISVVPVFIYKSVIAVFGLSVHWPLMLVLALMHAALGLGVYVLARPRIGAWPAVLVATLILFMGLAWQNMVWAFQIGFVGSVLGGVLAWVALDRRSRTADVLACVALVISITSSSLGVPMALAVGVELLVSRTPRRLWIAVIPLVIYALWYVRYGIGTITFQGVVHMAPWAQGAVAAGAGALFGAPSDWGIVIAVLAVIGLGWRIAVAPPTPRLLGLLAAGISFWALTGAARSVFQPPVTPDQSRYLTFSAIVIALLAVEAAAGLRMPGRVTAYLAGVTVVAVALGFPTLRDNAVRLRTITQATRAELTGVDLSRATVAASYQPDPAGSQQITAGPYLAAVHAQGSSPAFSIAEATAASPADRVQTDRVLQDINAHPTPAEPAADGPAPVLGAGTAGTQTARGACRLVRPSAGAPAVVIAILPPQGLVVRALGSAAAQLKLRRFADTFANASLATVAADRPVLLKLPADRAPQRYVLQVSGPSGAAVCRA
ncbi:MAG: hypothetical protein ACXVFN_20040 [Solirubrobacteraceae bacterium]